MIVRSFLFALLSLASWAVAAATITSVTVTNTGSATQTNGYVTFGHYFKQGDVPSGMTVGATRSDGSAVTLQVDAKASYADGSLKHAILTALVPSLAGNSSEILTLKSQSPAGGAVTPVALSSLLSSGFDAVTSLNVGGTVYSASAKTLLTALSQLPAAEILKQTWLSGPLVSEWLVGAPVKTSGGTSHAHLTAYFHVRAYTGSPITRASVDLVVENNWTLVASPGDKTYDATLTVGGTPVYSQTGLTHFTHARWHQRAWWGGDPQLYAQLDKTYLQASKALPQYENVTPTDSFLNSARQSTAPMTIGDHRANMDDTGAQDGIGPVPRWDAVYAVSTDKRAYNYMKANADGGGAYPIHFRDEVTQLPVTIDSYPNAMLSDPNYSSPVIPEGTSASNNNPGSFASHQPSIGYTAYLATGDYYYLEEMQFWSSYNLIWVNTQDRKGPGGYSTNPATGVWYPGTIRGMAWATRSLAQAASITPDSHPLKAYFKTKLDNNMNYLKWAYVDANLPEANALGAFYSIEKSSTNQYRTFYDNFMSWALQYTVDLGFDSAKPIRDYKMKTPIGMMGVGSNEFCFQMASEYNWILGPNNSTFYGTFKEAYDATWPGVAAAHTCGTQDMAAYLTSLNIEGQTIGLNGMLGHQDQTNGFYANLQIALAAAADSGVAGGTTAWARGQLSAVHPNYADNPTFAVVPRNASGTPAPSVTFTANPSAVGSGQSTTLTWTSSNATGCTASGGWSGAKSTSGSQAMTNLTANVTYTLTCSGTGGSSSQSVLVTVVSPPPTVTFTASATSLPYNGSMTLTWSSTNATQCAATGAWTGSKATSGTQTFSNLTAGGTYTLTCTGTGGSASQNVTTTVALPAPTSTLSASATSIAYNGSSTLTWTSTNATSCTASGGWSGTKAIPNGSQVLSGLTSTATYTLDCSNTTGTVSKSVTITVAAAPAPTLTLTASATSVAYNGSTTLTWSSTNTTNCTASSAWTGTKAVSGTETRSNLTASGTFTLMCSGAGGSITQSVLVNVLPSVTLTASPTSIAYNATSALTWSSQNATDCTGSGAWTGVKATSGSQNTGSLTATSTYTLTCTGTGGSASASATVTVAPQAGMPTVTLSANPTSVASGGTTILTWSSTNTTSCTASGAWNGAKATSGTATSGALTAASNSFTLTCVDASANTAAQTVTVSVPPTVTLTANPTSVAYNGATTLTWSSTNAASCTASGAWSGSKATSGTQAFSSLTSSKTYTLTCGGVSASATVNVAAAVMPTVSLSSNATAVLSNGSITLTWASTDASTCAASATPVVTAWSGSKATSGSQTISGVTANTTYGLSCTGAGGTASQTVSVMVTATPPTVTLSADNTSVAYDGSVTLTWVSTNTSSCGASGMWSGSKATSGTEVISALTTSGKFTLDCAGVTGGSASASIDVTVAAPVAPDVTLTSDTTTVSANGTANLDWNSSGADYCVASGKWNGNKPKKGNTKTDPLTSTSTYSMFCVGPGGTSATKSIVIAVQKDASAPDTNNTAAAKKVGGGSFDVLAMLSLLAMFGARARTSHRRRA